MAFKIDADYKEVAERLVDLFAKFPEARLQGDYKIIEIGSQSFVIYRAECFRDVNDPLPGVGTAIEEIPGTTSFTKGSEIQNAETSAWGRAIVAIGASTSKRIASAEDVRNAEARQGEAPADTFKNKRAQLHSRGDALLADKVDVKAERLKWQLPPISASDERQLGLWAEMLAELEKGLEAPFVVETAGV